MVVYIKLERKNREELPASGTTLKILAMLQFHMPWLGVMYGDRETNVWRIK